MNADSAPEKPRGSLPKDAFGRSEIMQWGCQFLPAIIAVLAAVFITLLPPRFRSKTTVVVYASQDQVYAEPILKDFEKLTGIKVRAVYDSEAVKTVAIANRLLAERSHPQCDIFWGNEELRTR